MYKNIVKKLVLKQYAFVFTTIIRKRKGRVVTKLNVNIFKRKVLHKKKYLYNSRRKKWPPSLFDIMADCLFLEYLPPIVTLDSLGIVSVPGK